jgi:transcriptional regulator with XRE-family HTH domain
MTEELSYDEFVDVHVGQRIRLRRRLLKVSQDALAESLGITYQQVQKYERATNRVSASKLLAVARALGVPVGYFYEGLEDRGGDLPPLEDLSLAQRMLTEKGGLELAQAYLRIRNENVRRGLVNLADSLTESDDA